MIRWLLWKIGYWTRDGLLVRCPKCHQRFSDWFVWSNGFRHCFPCWRSSRYEFTILEDGRKVPG